jgi:hypothetical protein
LRATSALERKCPRGFRWTWTSAREQCREATSSRVRHR